MTFFFDKVIYNDIKKISNNMYKQKNIGGKMFTINTVKDERCSRDCYLNWVIFNMIPPKYNFCKCKENYLKNKKVNN